MYLKSSAVISIFLLALSLTILWLIRLEQTTLPRSTVDQPVSIEGVVENDPKQFYDQRTFQVNGLKVIGTPQRELRYGDYVHIEGVLTIEGSIKQAHILILKHNRGNPLLAVLSQVRRTLLPIPRQFLPSREAALISGLVLGEKTNGDKGYIEALRKTGTLHIIVVSGANLTMVAGFFLQLKGVIGLKPAIASSIAVVWLYALLTGGQAPVMRAAIMVSLAFMAKLFGRQQWQLYSLLAAAVVMLLINPKLLVEISFQLSFAATLGIILFAQQFYNYLDNFTFKLGKQTRHLPFSIAENLSTTLAAQLLVIPLILYHFQEISLLSPIVNVLVLPVVFYLTLFGALLLVFGYFSTQLGTIISWFILLPANYFSTVILLFAKFPFISMKLAGFNAIFVGAYYFYVLITRILLQPRGNIRQEEPQFATINP